MHWLKWQWVLCWILRNKDESCDKMVFEREGNELGFGFVSCKVYMGHWGTDGLRMDFSSFPDKLLGFSDSLLFWTAFFYGVNRIFVFTVSVISYEHVSLWISFLPLLLYSVSETWLNSKSWCPLIFVMPPEAHSFFCMKLSFTSVHLLIKVGLLSSQKLGFWGVPEWLNGVPGWLSR